MNCWYSVFKLCPTLLWLHGLKPFRLLCLWVFPGKNPGVGCHFLLQGSSWPRGWTHVSCIDQQVFYRWTTREAPKMWIEVCISTRVLISPDFCSTSLNGLFQGIFWKYSTMPMDLWSMVHFEKTSHGVSQFPCSTGNLTFSPALCFSYISNMSLPPQISSPFPLSSCKYR